MKVKIGEVFFEQKFLEDEANFLAYLRRVRCNPYDLEAHLALGVIHEYRGQPAQAIGYYWSAYQLDPHDEYIQQRLRELLSLLSQSLPGKLL
ncbi:Tetratricopeptide repeat [Thermanaeromonas toyohensis ToBE]|uniref:Tetratricopeptide repeat n=1 Tax=Thermanaeromonas toyohensis ToBE TaxID=698762 RepID=A0A1W1VYH2_9FIRM|nr:hypothetical protein [Thermanaeromonas toyohensis]SMB97904.1 Tetratricopeptide repeat [Thermanaeromonas toyohensis ToBE]